MPPLSTASLCSELLDRLQSELEQWQGGGAQPLRLPSSSEAPPLSSGIHHEVLPTLFQGQLVSTVSKEGWGTHSLTHSLAHLCRCATRAASTALECTSRSGTSLLSFLRRES